MSIELGGKNPNIVFADADFEAAVDGALFGAFANQGEVCSAGSRLLVERSIYDRMLDGAGRQGAARSASAIRSIARPKMGPLVTREHREKVLELHRDRPARRAGCSSAAARRTTRRSRAAASSSRRSSPTSTTARASRRRRSSARCSSVIPFDDEDEAVRIANDTPYGLAGAVWTRDVFRGIRVLKQIRAGILWLNTYHPTYNEAPWGGYKQSGFGRELGPYGLEQYLETKQINVNLVEAPIGWY